MSSKKMINNKKCYYCGNTERIGQYCNLCGKNLVNTNSPAHLMRTRYKPRTIIVARAKGNKTVEISSDGKLAYIGGGTW
jgi:hypothetical protein